MKRSQLPASIPQPRLSHAHLRRRRVPNGPALPGGPIRGRDGDLCTPSDTGLVGGSSAQRAKRGSKRRGRPRPGCPRSPAPTSGRRLPLAPVHGPRLRPAASSGLYYFWRCPSAAFRRLEKLSRLLI